MENPKCKACGEDYIEVVCDGVTQYNHNCKENYKCIYCGKKFKERLEEFEDGSTVLVGYYPCSCQFGHSSILQVSKDFQKLNQVIDEELLSLNKQIEYHQKNKQSNHKEKYKKRYKSKHYGKKESRQANKTNRETN